MNIDDNEKEPLVSVVVPVYNCEKYIGKCLASILEQEYQNIEIIVTDDGSSDKSAEIVKQKMNADSRIYLLQQQNMGVAIARNNAIDFAKGKYLLFVDADDFIGKSYIRELVDCAEKNQSQLVFCGYTMLEEQSGKSVRVMPKHYIQGISEEWAYIICVICSRMYLRQFWLDKKLSFISEEGSRGEDMPICIYTNAMAKNISMIQSCEYYYVQHEGSAMSAKKIFRFPYKAAVLYYRRIQHEGIQNNRDYLYMAMLKMFALFKYKLYQKADKKEKEYFSHYINTEYKNDMKAMKKAWFRLLWKIDLPLQHKVAITLLCIRH
ncbi:MAG: glycosyltransferase family 2 protein [Lachnospiraceae bacterium]|nr:glycosyltransferase family 2 protein [Lachnospiraceae bacterium]